MTRKVNARGKEKAQILIVGDFPTMDSVQYGYAFAGASENTVADLLGSCKINFRDVRYTYACQYRPEKGNIFGWMASKFSELSPGFEQINGKWVSKEIKSGRDELFAEIERTKPNVIITMGNLALWALTGNWGAKNWRGSLMLSEQTKHKCKIVPTIALKDLYASPEWLPIIKRDFARATKESHDLVMPERAERFIVRPSLEQVLSHIALLKDEFDKGNVPACDIETRGGNAISCVGFAWSSQDAICIPLMDVTKPHGYWNEEEEVQIYWAIYNLFKYIAVSGQNFYYDLQIFFYKYYLEPKLKYDTMVTHHSFIPSGKMDTGEEGVRKSSNPAERKGLGFISSLYCKDHLYWKEEREDWDDEAEYWTYNCRDCVRTWEINDIQQRLKHKRHPKQAAVTDFQNELLGPIWRMMKRGIRIDHARKAEFVKSLKLAIKEREDWLKEVLGHELNIKSPAQMKALFYEDFQCKVIKKKSSAGGMAITCDDAALSTIAEREPLLQPIINCIQELRSLGVFLKTFAEVKLDEDGRFRFAINIAGTKTYRFSSTKTALGTGTNSENIPANQKKKDGVTLSLPDIRTMFIPDEGKEIADTDLDSADLRIVAAESECWEMWEWFDAGLKPYVEIAKEYYHDPSIDKEHWAYKIFKSLCHGTNYLGEAAGLASRTGLLVIEVERIQKWYFGKFPGIRQWQERIKAQIGGRRYVENAFGNRCNFLGRIDDASYREGVAWIPQSTVALVINRGLVNIDNNLPQVELLNQVHDSLVMQYPIEGKEKTLAEIKEQTRIIVPYPKPLIIPVGFKTSQVSWGDC